ncbi:MAG: hypothetical protein R3C69_12210 [Geminicoccaceae bacterium]
MRGFGHVKERNVREAKAAEAALLRRLDADAKTPVGSKAVAASLSP